MKFAKKTRVDLKLRSLIYLKEEIPTLKQST